MSGRPAPAEADPQDSHHPITMTVGDSTFRARSQCVAFWRRYASDGGRLTVKPDNPGAMCARGLSHWETEFERSLSAVDRTERVGDRLTLSGNNVHLAFTALPSLEAAPITGRWRLSRFQGAAPAAGAPPFEITVSSATIETNACVFAGWRYRQAGSLLELTPAEAPVCERTRTEQETRLGHFMDGVSRATVLADGKLILDSAAEQAEFSRVG